MLCLTLCVSKLNLFVCIGASLGRCTVRCYFFFQNLSFEIRGAAYLRVRLIHECLRYLLLKTKNNNYYINQLLYYCNYINDNLIIIVILEFFMENNH